MQRQVIEGVWSSRHAHCHKCILKHYQSNWQRPPTDGKWPRESYERIKKKCLTMKEGQNQHTCECECKTLKHVSVAAQKAQVIVQCQDVQRGEIY